MKRQLPLLVFLLACGRSAGTSENAGPRREDGGVARAEAPAALAPLALGMPDLADFAYRARTGQDAFKLARASEAKGDWTQVAARCREALTADPNHLDASYLYAVALAKTGGGPEQILTPLTKAVAADYAKWGQASLDQPALQPFLASTIGQAWRQRVEADRAPFLAALARSLIVTSQNDLFAYDREGKRWYRLTRTGGAVVATLHVHSQKKLAYVTREKVKDGAKQRTKVGIGVVDLATGKTRRSIEVPHEVPASATLRIGYAERPTPGFIVRAGKVSWRLVENGKLDLVKLPANAKADAPALLADMVRMDVTGRTARIDRTAVANVAADWDDNSLASAIKIGRSKKVVTVPSPGLIDGDTATWNTDGTELAFVAQLSDTCAPNVATAAAFVADGATGSVHELERALGGIAVEWYGERTLAIAGDHGVSIVALDGSAPLVLTGADGLVTPRRKPKCSPEPIVEEPIAEDEESTTEPSDAGVDAK
ncbi:MAG TPA: hypothetical protein VFV99_32570 [Kofleriaceae bacterium]|nr:hypothetical protein [Kofleriaceae bacterium]